VDGVLELLVAPLLVEAVDLAEQVVDDRLGGGDLDVLLRLEQLGAHRAEPLQHRCAEVDDRVVVVDHLLRDGRGRAFQVGPLLLGQQVTEGEVCVLRRARRSVLGRDGRERLLQCRGRLGVGRGVAQQGVEIDARDGAAVLLAHDSISPSGLVV
jgi:hypothetical protein